MARTNEKIDNMVDGLGDLTSIVSLIPGLQGVIAFHLTVKHAVKFMRKKGIIKENIPANIKKDFEEVLEKTLQHTADKIYSSEYKDFLGDTYIRLEQVLDKEKDVSKITFDKLYELMKPCMEESIKTEKFQITPNHTNEFIDKVNQTFAEELYSYPKYGAYINCINILEIRKKVHTLEGRITAVEKDVNSIKSNKPHKEIVLPNIVKGNDKLIGREDDIEKVSELLKVNQPVVLVNGIGGVGKSALCKHYCMKYGKDVGWFDYEESLENTLLKIADVSKLSTEAGRCSEFIRVKGYLRSLPNDVILAFDNVSKQVQEEIDFLCSLNCRVILTSRHTFKAYSKVFKKHELMFLTLNACKELFSYYCEDKKVNIKDGYLDKIINLTGFHTLTIELLAKIYDTASKIETLQDLWTLLDEKRFNLSNKISASGNIEEKEFIEHLQLLFDISDVTDEEIRVLKNLCLLPSLPVKEAKILDWIGDDFEEALHSLINSGWLKKEDKNITMHNVICETLQIKLSPSYKECKRLIEALIEEIPKDKSNPERYNAKYLPQCAGVADYFYTKEFDKDDIAYFYYIVADAYQAKGEYEEALRCYNKALDIQDVVLGNGHPDTATTYNNIAGVYQDKGEYEEALRYYNKALDIKDVVLGKGHPSTATTYNNIAVTYAYKEEFELALDMTVKALIIWLKTLGQSHPTVKGCLESLQVIYHASGKPAEKFEDWQNAKFEELNKTY